MALKDNINTAIKEAMKAKDRNRLEALRSIKTAIMTEETKEGASEMDDAAEITMLTRMLKQRRESAKIFSERGRDEMATEENAQALVIEEFLPKQLTDDELKKEIEAIISAVGASGPKDMGKVMGKASKDLAGRAEGKKIADTVKAILNS